MPDPSPAVSPDVSEYRFAPAVSARIVGGLLVVLAVVLVAVTLVVAVAGLSALVLAAAAAVGVAGVFLAGHLLTRRIPSYASTPRATGCGWCAARE